MTDTVSNAAIRVSDALWELPISRDRYVLVGSGPMALKGIRDEVGDLDVFTTTRDWFDLSQKDGWEIVTTSPLDVRRRCDPPIIRKTLNGIEVNVFFDWRLRGNDLLVNVSDELALAEPVRACPSNGEGMVVQCMALERLIAWKLSAGRPKDYADIARIAQYLTNGT